VYSGEWESGFESSVFQGCNGTAPRKVWLTLAPGAARGVEWPGTVGASATRRYFVRVRGILRGPVVDRRRVGGGYGHLGGSDYELYVTRVLEVKPPGEPSCAIR
jgi:hypothetical protein